MGAEPSSFHLDRGYLQSRFERKQIFYQRCPSPFAAPDVGRFSLDFMASKRWLDYARTLEIPAVMPVIPALHKSRLVIIASALLLCAMAGCGSSQNDIVGKWRAMGDSSAMVWEFSKDGSVLMGSTRGKYSFGDNKRVKIQTPFGTSVYQMEFTPDRMVLKAPGGSKLEFTRLK